MYILLGTFENGERGTGTFENGNGEREHLRTGTGTFENGNGERERGTKNGNIFFFEKHVYTNL